MKPQTILTTAISLLILSTATAQTPGDGAKIEGTHPAFTMETLTLPGQTTVGASSFEPQITGMDFMSDGTLIMSTISKESEEYISAFHGHTNQAPGYVYAIKDLLTTSSGNATAEVVADAMNPTGLTIVDDVIYTVEYDALNRLVDDNGDGTIDSKEVIYGDFLGSGERQWTFGPVHKDGFLFIAPGVTMHGGNSRFPQTFDDAGNILMISMDGSVVETYATGFRQPDGLFWGPEGDLFTTEDQGTFRPSSPIVHVQVGEYHGHESTLEQVDQVPVNAHTWMVHKQISQSPHKAWYVTSGIHRGQLYVPELAWGNTVNRVFMERVEGVYQGNIHHFTGELLAGARNIIEGPDGSYYIGCLGNKDNGNWGWNGTTWGFHRITPNGNVPFEILAVRSLGPWSYEMEFTKPVQTNVSAGHFEIEQYGFEMLVGYGDGNMINREDIIPTSVERNADGKKLTLTFADGVLKETYATHFRLVNLKSTENEPPWAHETWYQLNRYGPAEKPGCLDDAYQEYDATADYDPGSGVACINLKTSVKDGLQMKRLPGSAISVSFVNGKAVLTWPGYKMDHVEIYDVRGQLVFEKATDNSTRATLPGEYLAGVMIVKATGREFTVSKKIAGGR